MMDMSGVNRRSGLFYLILEFGIAIMISQQCLGEGHSNLSANKMPERLRRSASFFGIHFDFHATGKDSQIGKDVTHKMIYNIIDKVKPDYVQCDSKGHPGYSSYPTTVGNSAPGFVRDPLQIWREATAERGVALYVHYSGVWDSRAIELHPDWAVINKDGNVDKNITSVFGPYVNKLLIPQLKEIYDKYKVDGVWVDGDCWAVKPDYSKYAIDAFESFTGSREIPSEPSDPRFPALLEFYRSGFRHYLNSYVETMHNYDPNFQIASNWAFSSLMPEPVTVDVDFLTGDLTSSDSVNAARIDARCFRNQKKPWELMAWGFHHSWKDACFNTKSARQLQREAAVVLSLGGGFSIYCRQQRDASIYGWEMGVMGEVAKFCRDRQKYCHKATSVPQIGILFSKDALYKSAAKESKIFGTWGELILPFKGVLQALLNSQYSVDVLMDHNINDGMKEYPLVVIPEWDHLAKDSHDEILEYVKNGGSLLVIGPQAAGLFREQLGITFLGEPTVKEQWLEHNGAFAGIKSLSQAVKLVDTRVKPFGRLFMDNEANHDFLIAASIVEYGKGRIAATYFNFGERYSKARTAIARDFLNSLVRELFSHPMVEVYGSHDVDVIINHTNGKLAVNLVNTSGQHENNDVYVFDEIDPIGPLTVEILSKVKPKKVTIQPMGTKVKYSYIDDKIKFTLPQLDLHDVIIVE